MSAISTWSTTAGNNNAAAPNGFPENMAPSAVNDACRALMAAIRSWYNDPEWIDYGDGDLTATVAYASGTTFTVAGVDVTGTYTASRRIRAVGSTTGTIYGTITTSSFSTNTTVTVAWDSGNLENEAITISLAAIRGQETTATILGLTPVGTVLAFAGATAPKGWLLCYGQAVSRSTYSRLFTVISTTHGTGDGSTTFNVPDLRGRGAVGKDDMGGSAASRITTAVAGFDGTALGAAGGTQSHVLTEAQMPAHDHGTTTSVESRSHTHALTVIAQGGNIVPVGSGAASLTTSNVSTGNASQTHTHTITSAGSGSAHLNVQPSIILNYIIYSGV